LERHFYNRGAGYSATAGASDVQLPGICGCPDIQGRIIGIVIPGRIRRGALLVVGRAYSFRAAAAALAAAGCVLSLSGESLVRGSDFSFFIFTRENFIIYLFQN